MVDCTTVYSIIYNYSTSTNVAVAYITESIQYTVVCTPRRETMPVANAHLGCHV